MFRRYFFVQFAHRSLSESVKRTHLLLRPYNLFPYLKFSFGTKCTFVEMSNLRSNWKANAALRPYSNPQIAVARTVRHSSKKVRTTKWIDSTYKSTVNQHNAINNITKVYVSEEMYICQCQIEVFEIFGHFWIPVV